MLLLCVPNVRTRLQISLRGTWTSEPNHSPVVHTSSDLNTEQVVGSRSVPVQSSVFLLSLLEESTPSGAGLPLVWVTTRSFRSTVSEYSEEMDCGRLRRPPEACRGLQSPAGSSIRSRQAACVSCESAPQVGHCVQTEAQICSVFSSSFIFIMCCVSLNEDEHVHSLQPQ